MSISALLLAATLAGGPIDEVRDAELAFAKAFADRDKNAFFALVADDATFLSGRTTSTGKARVIDAWSRYFDGAEAPFSWAPERVSVSADGTLGLSTGQSTTRADFMPAATSPRGVKTRRGSGRSSSTAPARVRRRCRSTQ